MIFITPNLQAAGGAGIRDIHSFTKRQPGRGATVDIGVYNMHASLYAMGYPKPVRVSAITEDYISQQDPRFKDIMDVEEFGAAWVRFENGGVMVFKISWAVHQDSLGGNFHLGTKAGFSLSGPVIYADAYDGELKKFVEAEGLTAEPNPPEGMTTIQFSGFPQSDNWAAQMIAFREAVKADAPFHRYHRRGFSSRT